MGGRTSNGLQNRNSTYDLQVTVYFKRAESMFPVQGNNKCQIIPI